MGTADHSGLNNPAGLGLFSRLKFLAKDSALYGGAAAVSKAFSLISFPIIARSFSVEEYGLIDLFGVWGGLLALLFIFGQDSAVARFFYEYDDENRRKQIVSQSLAFQIFVCAVFIPPVWHFGDFFAAKLCSAAEATLWFQLILLQVPFQILNNFSQNLLKWSFARWQFLTLSLGSVIFSVLSLVIGVLFFHLGVTGIIGIYLANRIIFGILGMYFVRKWLVWPENYRLMRGMLAFAIPCGVMSGLGAFVPAMERSVVNSMMGSYELGLYAAGTRLAMLLTFFVQAFQTAWGPFSLSIFKAENSAETFNWVLKLFTFTVCSVTLLISAMAHPMLALLASQKFVSGSLVVFPLTMALAIESISWITEIGIGISKKSYLSLLSYAIYIGGIVTGVVTFASHLGVVGVAFGILFGQTLKCLFQSFLAQRAYPIAWDYRSVVSMIVITLVSGISGVFVYQKTPILASTIFGSGFLLVAAFLWLLAFSASEKGKIVAIGRAGLNLIYGFAGKGTGETR